jgi:hypothetical protein
MKCIACGVEQLYPGPCDRCEKLADLYGMAASLVLLVGLIGAGASLYAHSLPWFVASSVLVPASILYLAQRAK